ncbi:MAG: hypothetical protein WA807_13425 [Steroidobacteraceae bacterium]
MISEVEARIHKALEAHPLEKIEGGYRRTHETGSSTLRLLPANVIRDQLHVVAVAEIDTKYNAGLPPFNALGLQRLNATAVHGAYHFKDGRLRQTAQYSIYSNEPASHLAAQCILNAFGAQLPIGRSTALAAVSPAVLEQQRAHHGMPRQWPKPLDEESLKAATTLLQGRGLAASNDQSAVWAEFPLSGDCVSRAIDPQAETALLQVTAAVPHPIAGAGYLSTITLPLTSAPPNSAEICRRLNAMELEQVDFVPRLGAWGLQGPHDLPGYCCFMPCAEPWGDLHITLMWWGVMRAAWIREKLWAAKTGLQLP